MTSYRSPSRVLRDSTSARVDIDITIVQSGPRDDEVARALRTLPMEDDMLPFVLALVLTAAVLLPKTVNAQAYQLPTPPPQVTAKGAAWSVSGQPIFYAGAFYYPTG